MKLGQRTKARSAPAARHPPANGAKGGDGATTDRRILDHARRAFNERGVASVGIREIARDLGLSPGNVSYHFATKEALIAALVRDGHARNTASLQPPGPARTFEALDAALRVVMQGDVDNRWLLRDYVGLLVTMPAMRALHDQLQGPRQARVEAVIAGLLEAGLLERDKVERRREELRRQLFTQVFFWLPSALATAPDRDPAESLDACARAAMALFLPYCTPVGRRQLEALLDRAGPDRPRMGASR
jgi:AcrR family transcriptional regulator